MLFFYVKQLKISFTISLHHHDMSLQDNNNYSLDKNSYFKEWDTEIEKAFLQKESLTTFLTSISYFAPDSEVKTFDKFIRTVALYKQAKKIGLDANPEFEIDVVHLLAKDYSNALEGIKEYNQKTEFLAKQLREEFDSHEAEMKKQEALKTEKAQKILATTAEFEQKRVKAIVDQTQKQSSETSEARSEIREKVVTSKKPEMRPQQRPNMLQDTVAMKVPEETIVLSSKDKGAMVEEKLKAPLPGTAKVAEQRTIEDIREKMLKKKEEEKELAATSKNKWYGHKGNIYWLSREQKQSLKKETAKTISKESLKKLDGYNDVKNMRVFFPDVDVRVNAKMDVLTGIDKDQARYTRLVQMKGAKRQEFVDRMPHDIEQMMEKPKELIQSMTHFFLPFQGVKKLADVPTFQRYVTSIISVGEPIAAHFERHEYFLECVNPDNTDDILYITPKVFNEMRAVSKTIADTLLKASSQSIAIGAPEVRDTEGNLLSKEIYITKDTPIVALDGDREKGTMSIVPRLYLKSMNAIPGKDYLTILFQQKSDSALPQKILPMFNRSSSEMDDTLLLVGDDMRTVFEEMCGLKKSDKLYFFQTNALGERVITYQEVEGYFASIATQNELYREGYESADGQKIYITTKSSRVIDKKPGTLDRTPVNIYSIEELGKTAFQKLDKVDVDGFILHKGQPVLKNSEAVEEIYQSLGNPENVFLELRAYGEEGKKQTRYVEMSAIREFVQEQKEMNSKETEKVQKKQEQMEAIRALAESTRIPSYPENTNEDATKDLKVSAEQVLRGETPFRRTIKEKFGVFSMLYGRGVATKNTLVSYTFNMDVHTYHIHMDRGGTVDMDLKVQTAADPSGKVYFKVFLEKAIPTLMDNTNGQVYVAVQDPSGRVQFLTKEILSVVVPEGSKMVVFISETLPNATSVQDLLKPVKDVYEHTISQKSGILTLGELTRTVLIDKESLRADMETFTFDDITLPGKGIEFTQNMKKYLLSQYIQAMKELTKPTRYSTADKKVEELSLHSFSAVDEAWRKLPHIEDFTKIPDEYLKKSIFQSISDAVTKSVKGADKNRKAFLQKIMLKNLREFATLKTQMAQLQRGLY